MGFTEKSDFQEGFTKEIASFEKHKVGLGGLVKYKGGLPKKGGLGQFADLRECLVKKKRRCF